MNRPGIPSNVSGLHHIPYPLPDNPFPGFVVILRLRGLLLLLLLFHLSPGLGVSAQPLGLESCRIEDRVVSHFTLAMHRAGVGTGSARVRVCGAGRMSSVVVGDNEEGGNGNGGSGVAAVVGRGSVWGLG